MKFNPENQNWIKLAKIGLNLTKIDQKIPHFGSYWEILIVIFTFFIFLEGGKGGNQGECAWFPPLKQIKL